MATEAIKPGTRRGPRASFGVAILGLAVLGGCSEIPDALNPVEWYKDTVDYLSEDERAGGDSKGAEKSGLAADRGAPPPGAGKPFPNLASVPERPKPTPAEQRRSAVEGLVADAERRRYSSETITRQGEPAGTFETTAKEPPPVPSFPVAQAPVAPVPVTQAPAAPVMQPLAAPVMQPPAAPAIPSSPPPPPAALPGGVEEAYRAGLAQRLPQGGSAQPAAGGLPANAQAAIAEEPFSTVVVSSAGVELVNFGAPPPARPLAGLTARPAFRAGMAPPASAFTLSGSAQMVATIQFTNGSSRLDARDRRILRDVSLLQRQGGGKVTVIGHASHRTRNMDTDRHNRVNQQISRDRADAVSRELIRLGVAAGDIEVSAMSDFRPLYYEFMPSGEAGNRRTEIYFGG